MRKPSPLRNPLGKRGSACVEVMTTLHRSIPSPWRRVEGCVPSEGTIASARDPLAHPFYLIDPIQPCRLAQIHLRFHSYTSVHLWTFRVALVMIGFSLGIRLSTFGLFSYALDSYRVTFILHLIQCFHICRRVYCDQSKFAFVD